MNLKFKAEQKPERRSGIRKRRCYLWLLLLPVGIVLFAASCGGNPSASLEHCTPAVPAGDPGPVIPVLCYNIQSRPVLDDAAGKNPRIGRKLAQYDFAGIQELFASPGKVFEAADSSIGGGGISESGDTGSRSSIRGLPCFRSIGSSTLRRNISRMKGLWKTVSD